MPAMFLCSKLFSLLFRTAFSTSHQYFPVYPSAFFYFSIENGRMAQDSCWQAFQFFSSYFFYGWNDANRWWIVGIKKKLGHLPFGDSQQQTFYSSSSSSSSSSSFFSCVKHFTLLRSFSYFHYFWWSTCFIF